ncbi:15065_t:CDS:2, partial [Acaulospora morrowiae]
MKHTYILVIVLLASIPIIAFAINPQPSIKPQPSLIRIQLIRRNVSSTPQIVKNSIKRNAIMMINLHKPVHKRASLVSTSKISSTSTKITTSAKTSSSTKKSSSGVSTSTKSSSTIKSTKTSSTSASTSTKTSSTSTTSSSSGQIQAIGVIGIANDVEWVAQISLGSTQQPFLIDIDTGSADLWVPSVNCVDCGNHRMFNPQGSSTYVALDIPFQIQYADGGGSQGLVEQDTLQVGYMSVKNQRFAMITSMSYQFVVDVVDGVMGLGYDSLSMISGTATPLTNMVNQGLIPHAIFSLQLRPARIQSSYGGEYVFGGVDSTLFTGPITYTSVTRQLYWQIAIDSVELNGLIVGGSKQQVIVDSGSALMILGTSVVNTIIKKVGGMYDSVTGTWQVPCNLANQTNPPKIAIRINKVAWIINTLDIVREASSNNFCYSGLVSTDQSVWILGGVFLKNVYAVFDREQNRVGFAKPVYT